MSFDEYVAARGLALSRFAYVLTGDRHQAEDLLQAALLKTYRNWDKVRRADHPDAYVRRILVTTHTSWARRLWHREHSVAELPEAATGGRLDDPADRVAERDALRRGLAGLPPRQRAVLVLRHLEGYDDAAIADVLGCSVSAVRSYASKGATRLRDVLAPPSSDPAPTTLGGAR
ncbi:SigE family RNA polymerase sigma factor [Motilibacter deserti]|uniref:SigE family RNA polymerase sigma factor n=1 Tax=Motilibacter deserti TaxID=2714956 RepID=A0ABX0GVX1_9ACTN|nr:SigE family RNA polymerase sigma factor [Motilibacter deserti]